MVSVVVVVNNEEIYKKYLYSSLLTQIGEEYEIIKIDNTKGQYKSLCQAYYGLANQVRGDWILFIHPDVMFLATNNLSDFVIKADAISAAHPEYAIFGVAGARFGDEKDIVTKIYQGKDKKKRENGFIVREFEDVQTVDACCFMIRKKTYERYGFCNLIDGFHLLVEELCVRIGEDNGKICVLPISLWHLSPGSSMDYRYYLATKKVLKLHPLLAVFNTTSYHWKRTSWIFIQLDYYVIRNYLHHRLIGKKQIDR